MRARARLADDCDAVITAPVRLSRRKARGRLDGTGPSVEPEKLLAPRPGARRRDSRAPAEGGRRPRHGPAQAAQEGAAVPARPSLLTPSVTGPHCRTCATRATVAWRQGRSRRRDTGPAATRRGAAPLRRNQAPAAGWHREVCPRESRQRLARVSSAEQHIRGKEAEGFAPWHHARARNWLRSTCRQGAVGLLARGVRAVIASGRPPWRHAVNVLVTNGRSPCVWMVHGILGVCRRAPGSRGHRFPRSHGPLKNIDATRLRRG